MATQNRDDLSINNEFFIKSIVNLSPDVLYIYDIVERRNLYSNDGIETVMGYSAEELLEMGENIISILMHPDDFTNYASTIIPKYYTAADGERIRHIYRMKHRDGSWKWLESIESIYLRCTDGSPKQIFGVIHDITAAKQHSEITDRNAALLLQSQRVAKLGHYVLDIVSGTWSSSLALDEIFGIDADYLRDIDGWGNLLHPDDKKEMLEYFTVNILQNHEYFDREYRICKADTGQTLWIHGRGSLEFDSAGKVTEMFGTIQDITEKKLAENALRESERRLNMLFENTGTANSIFDRDCRLTMQNAYSQRLLGGAVANSIGKTVEEIFGEETGSAVRDRMNRVMGNGLSEEFDTLFHLPVGTKWFRSSYQPLIEGDKNIIGLQIVSQDITETKTSELLLATEKERLAVTLRSIGDGVIATDTKGCVSIMNKVAEDLTGWSQQDAAGHPLAEVFYIVNETTGKICENPVVKVLATGHVIELANHTILRSKTGDERIIADSAAPILDNEGTVIGVVLVFRDMTEKQRLMDSAIRSQKLESIGVLAGGIAHDFNNLLGGIFGYLDLARLDSSGSNADEYIERALGALERAQGLTQQLLTFSKGGAPVKSVSNLFPFISETAGFALSGSNVSCTIDISSDLWPCSFDRNQIAQVIDNLIINAMQAMPLGGTIAISAANVVLDENEVATLRNGPFVKIKIRDCGTGIQAEILPRIFDPFFTTKQKGSGLGLATTYSIISRHDGAIEVESSIGKGTTFTIFLPALPETKVQSSQDFRSISSGTGRILIMDDEEVVREAMSEMLRRVGYTVESCCDGAEAVDLFTKETIEGRPFDAVILDLTIPGGMGGRDAVDLIKDFSPETPVYVASGYANDPIMANPTAYGFNGSIQKPFKFSELAAMIAAGLQSP